MKGLGRAYFKLVTTAVKEQIKIKSFVLGKSVRVCS